MKIRLDILDMIGGTGGGTVGFACIPPIVNALGVAGLSASGITSGLAALGGCVMTGVGVAAAFPVAGAAIGIGAVKGSKAAADYIRLRRKEAQRKAKRRAKRKAKRATKRKP